MRLSIEACNSPKFAGLTFRCSFILCVCVCVCVQQVVVDAVLAIRKEPKKPIDLHMVEIMEMMHKTDTDTRSVGIYR